MWCYLLDYYSWYQQYTSHNKNTKNDRITTHSIPLVIKTILHCFLGVWISLREGRVPVFNSRFSASSLCSALCELKLRILSALSAHFMLSRWHKCWLRAWLQPAPPRVYYREGKVSHRPFSASAEQPDPLRWQDRTWRTGAEIDLGRWEIWKWAGREEGQEDKSTVKNRKTGSAVEGELKQERWETMGRKDREERACWKGGERQRDQERQRESERAQRAK